MNLTKKSAKDLHNRIAGCGVLFAKIGDCELQIIEFGLGRNGKFYTIHGTELPVRLEELSREIQSREENRLRCKQD